MGHRETYPLMRCMHASWKSWQTKVNKLHHSKDQDRSNRVNQMNEQAGSAGRAELAGLAPFAEVKVEKVLISLMFAASSVACSIIISMLRIDIHDTSKIGLRTSWRSTT